MTLTRSYSTPTVRNMKQAQRLAVPLMGLSLQQEQQEPMTLVGGFSMMQISQVPFMSQGLFAELTGFSTGIVEGWVNRGYIPTLLIGKHRVINLVELTQSCMSNLSK